MMSLLHRPIGRLLTLLVALALAGCSGGDDSRNSTPGGSTNTPGGSTNVGTPPYSSVPESDVEAARFLTQATFGPNTSDILMLREVGYTQWLDEQIDPNVTPPTLIRPYLASLTAQGVDVQSSDNVAITLRRNYWLWQTVVGDDQLRMRVAFALSQIFVVSDRPFSQPRQAVYRLADYYDTLARGAFGSYRDLLEAVTLHPAMGFYLDHAGNEKANLERNIFPDQNFAREVMQLFSIGLVQLNPDHTPVLDGDGNPVSSYDDEMVAAFARVFTGWTYAGNSSAQFRRTEHSTHGPMQCLPEHHDDQPKTLFDGVTVHGGSDCRETLRQALDVLASHPNVAPFISRQLIQRLVTSNPSPGYIRRVTRVWHDTDGDLGAVVRAILLDNEARLTPTDPDFGKMREPLIRISAFWRAFDAHYLPQPDGTVSFTRFPRNTLEQAFAQEFMSAPSVFNFYSPNYQPSGDLQARGLVAPEFQIFNEATFNTSFDGLQRLFQWFVDEPPTEVGLLPAVDLRALHARVLDGDYAGIVEHFNVLLFAGSLSPASQALLVDMFEELESLRVNAELIAPSVVRFVFMMPEFNIQQ